VTITTGLRYNNNNNNNRPALEPTQPPIRLVHGFFPGVRWPKRDVYSHSRNVEVNNEWGYTSSPPIRLHGVDKYKFTFIIIIIIRRRRRSGEDFEI
jgi:hypothetical protein